MTIISISNRYSRAYSQQTGTQYRLFAVSGKYAASDFVLKYVFRAKSESFSFMKDNLWAVKGRFRAALADDDDVEWSDFAEAGSHFLNLC